MTFRPFWLDQALRSEHAAPCPPLAGDTRADVCIVGGGYTGLWTAIMLKEHDPGLDVVLVEADLCGAGASGRNGGCALSWSAKFFTLERLFGLTEAIRLVKASKTASGPSAPSASATTSRPTTGWTAPSIPPPTRPRSAAPTA